MTPGSPTWPQRQTKGLIVRRSGYRGQVTPARAIQELAGHADLSTAQLRTVREVRRYFGHRGGRGVLRSASAADAAAARQPSPLSIRIGSPSRSSRAVAGERRLERATGVEPVSEAWEASVLPLY